MKPLSRFVSLVLLVFLLCSCNPPKRKPEVLADTFFFGHAYVDANGNGKLDADDPGLEDAQFVVVLSGGAGPAARTGKDGSAFIVIPGGLSKDDWPVTMRMEPPSDADYEAVRPAELVLEYPGSSADFLFTQAKKGD